MALGKVGSRLERVGPAYEKAAKALRAMEASLAAAVWSATEQKSDVEAHILRRMKDMSTVSVAKAWTDGKLASSQARELQERLREHEVGCPVCGGGLCGSRT